MNNSYFRKPDDNYRSSAPRAPWIKYCYALKYSKSQIVCGIILVLIGCSGVLGQGLQQSHHDFRDITGNDDLCSPCHPSQTEKEIIAMHPLWDQDKKETDYIVYSSNTMDSQVGLPSGKSKLCLSCHDGTFAKEGHRGSTGDSALTIFGNLTVELFNDHPISFIYNEELARSDKGLYDPSTTESGLGGTIEEDLLEEGMLECTSCHDVHLTRNTEGCKGCHVTQPDGGTRTISLSLWKSNEGSALCLTCHKK